MLNNLNRLKTLSLPQRKFLLVMPVFALFFFCLAFTALKGGTAVNVKTDSAHSGLNPELPKASFDHNKTLQDKMRSYQEAGEDSLKKQEWTKRDPYHAIADSALHQATPKTDQLLQKLNALQETLHQSNTVPAITQPRPAAPPMIHHADPPDDDPQINKLNSMLDKVIRIQHPNDPMPATNQPTAAQKDDIRPADPTANVISATVPENQTLVTGTTMTLRLTTDILVNGQLIPKGQLVYGVATLDNDRLLVNVRSIRKDQNVYTTDWQVIDMDGIPGIRIPGLLSREVAKASADQGINGLTLTNIDPSIGAQAANAGVQAAKSFLSRKVRLVRVSVRAGYQVLLRETRPVVSPTRSILAVKDKVSVQPPGFDPGGSFLQRCRSDGMALALQGIYLKDSLLWFALQLQNRSSIAYDVDYTRWFIRDRRQFKRTARQEIPAEPLWSSSLKVISGDSSARSWAGFRPFALANDKELIIEVGEKNGGRTLSLTIGHKEILKAKRSAQWRNESNAAEKN